MPASEAIDGDHSRLQSSAPPSKILDAIGHGASENCSTLRRGMGVAGVSEDVTLTTAAGGAATPRIVTPGHVHVGGGPSELDAHPSLPATDSWARAVRLYSAMAYCAILDHPFFLADATSGCRRNPSHATHHRVR